MKDIHESQVRVVPLLTLRQHKRLLQAIAALQLLNIAIDLWGQLR